MKKKKHSWALYLVAAIMAATMFTGATLSRYVFTVSGGSTALVAAAQLSTEISSSTENLLPGGAQEITFEVTNSSELINSDVNLDYSITVASTGNLPLSYTLQCGGISAGNGTGIVSQTVATGSEISGGLLPGGKQVTHNYTLIVAWPAENNSAEYADEIDLITVTVKAVQA